MKAHHQSKTTQKRPFKAGHYQAQLAQRMFDPYKLPLKLSEPSVCPDCGAVYHLGRWQWLLRPDAAEEVLCSACHRIADHFPAGFLHISTELTPNQRDQLLHLIKHHETKASTEHPMERIMEIDEKPGHILITTTSVHLARDLGMAIEDAFHGSLQLKYSKDETLLRAYWKR